jgi:hypothetical protein
MNDKARYMRMLSDPQRLLWRDDVEGICKTIDTCFENENSRGRCGPCAIKQAHARGVDVELSIVANLPEVCRLQREAKVREAELAALQDKIKRIFDYIDSVWNEPKGQNEEKYLERSIQKDADDEEFLRIFDMAKQASYQRGAGTIVECKKAAVKILRDNFEIKAN